MQLLKQSLKSFYHLLKRTSKILFLVQFSITNRCNAKCNYCYAEYYNRNQKELSTSKVFEIVDNLKKMSTIRINLVGGEPLLREDIGMIIRHIKSKKMECALTTNGRLVPNKIGELKALDLLCISLDGDKSANDANRGDGSWESAMKAIKVAKQNGIPLQVSTVLTKNNLNSIEYLLNLAKMYNFKIGFTTLISPKKTEYDKIAPSDSEYKNILQRLIYFKKKNYPILFSLQSLKFALNWPLRYSADKIMDRTPKFKHPQCYAGKYFCIIDANGDIYPCPQLVDIFKPYNYFKHGLREALDHVAKHNCKTCHLPCSNDFNYLFGLNLAVVYNFIKNYRSIKCR